MALRRDDSSSEHGRNEPQVRRRNIGGVLRPYERNLYSDAAQFGDITARLLRFNVPTFCSRCIIIARVRSNYRPVVSSRGRADADVAKSGNIELDV